MADHNRDPFQGSDTEDQNRTSFEPTRKTDTLDSTWTTGTNESEVPHAGGSDFRTTVQAHDVSTLQRAALEGGDTEDTEPGLSEKGETMVQSEDTAVGVSGTSESSEYEIIPEIRQSDAPSHVPYASHVVLVENLLAFRRSMHDPESFRNWGYELFGSLAIPSPESPLERFLTQNWIEDANNLHARIHMRDLEVSWEGLSIEETRRMMARALVRQTTENARRAPPSDALAILEQEPPSDDEASMQ